MEKKTTKALYAYFGELGIFEENVPGHTFYQLGLIDALSDKYKIESFDFYNYMDVPAGSNRPQFPSGKLGDVFRDYADELIADYRIGFDSDLTERILNKEYSKLFLKARFRNLSTLQKKIFDADRFEKIIKSALAVGYEPSDIVILDTDLSLSESFLETITKLGISREIPSITMPGISKSFLNSCMSVHSEPTERSGMVYYGNLAFDNYKEGHSKNPIISSIIQKIDEVEKFDGSKFKLAVCCKRDSMIENWISSMQRVNLISRQNRNLIWQAMSTSLVSINVSKDLYIKERFIPARVYESVIFGVVPVSYKTPQLHPALSFNDEYEFFEICKFIEECSPADYFNLLTKVADSL